MSTLYQRRVEQEWRILQELAKTNPDLLQGCRRRAESGGERFQFTLRKTQAFLEQGGELVIIDKHHARIFFPRFFPALPLELSLESPVFHPNVHPETGFVCLWNRSSPGDTIAGAIAQLQRVITWELFNETADHLMQPKALEWYRERSRGLPVPLRIEALKKPPTLDLKRGYVVRHESVGRKRLE
jgi:ubiquitin-protein ligase